MRGTGYITIISNKKEIVINTESILYVLMERNKAEIHTLKNNIYETRMTLSELRKLLGDGFIMVHRGCLVSAKAIHDITDAIYLSNGEKLEYVIRNKKTILEQFRMEQKKIVNSFNDDGIPKTVDEYHSYYSSFDNMPFAFTDIEMVFDEERRAVDWIFRYGNPCLAQLEKLPLDNLVGNSFRSLFPNMDSKWLRCYENVTLYGGKREIIDYSPEIDAYLKVICFPTFKGHCGCILFNINEIEFFKNSSDAEKALIMSIRPE